MFNKSCAHQEKQPIRTLNNYLFHQHETLHQIHRKAPERPEATLMQPSCNHQCSCLPRLQPTGCDRKETTLPRWHQLSSIDPRAEVHRDSFSDSDDKDDMSLDDGLMENIDIPVKAPDLAKLQQYGRLMSLLVEKTHEILEKRPTEATRESFFTSNSYPNLINGALHFCALLFQNADPSEQVDSPSGSPSLSPSIVPSSAPSSVPPSAPSSSPSSGPSLSPSIVTSSAPSSSPSAIPSSAPSSKSRFSPSSEPSSSLSILPSAGQSCAPSNETSSLPSSEPSCTPSSVPSSRPSLTQ